MSEDLKCYLMFKSIIEQGDFKIQGKAITQVAFLMNWFNNLESKFRETVDEKPKKAPNIKPMGPPVKVKDV